MTETGIGTGTSGTSLPQLLADHDERVERAINRARDTATGTERVRFIHLLRRAISVHDSVVVFSLCPILRDLPGGSEVADRLQQGCEDRASLLGRFQELSQGTGAQNVYPMFGPEIEIILDELVESFDRHTEDETVRVGELLEASSDSVAPEVVASRMAMEAGRAPVRAHRLAYRHPDSKMLRMLLRGADRVHDWNDSHHGWPRSEPRPTAAVRPVRRFGHRPPAITDLLAGYDRTVELVIAELGRARSGSPAQAAAAYRLGAAISVHDAVVGGTLCPLLDAVPEGRAAAGHLREGCHERAALLDEWDDVVQQSSPSDLYGKHSGQATRIIDQLIGSFRAHEARETDDMAALIEHLRRRAWPYGGTGLISPYLSPVGPSPEPAVLAAQMALWADKAPTHPHRLLARHPSSASLRNIYRWLDNLSDWRRTRRGWPRLT